MTSIDFLNKVHKSLDSQEYSLSYSPAKSKNYMFRIIADKKNPNLSEYKHLLKTLDYTSEIDTFWLDEIAKL